MDLRGKSMVGKVRGLGKWGGQEERGPWGAKCMKEGLSMHRGLWESESRGVLEWEGGSLEYSVT